MSPLHGKKKLIAIILALLGTATPLSGLHKFYLGQPLWGVIYLLLAWQTPMVRIACAIDIVIYLLYPLSLFPANKNYSSSRITEASQITEVANAIRELERLRQEGLISEYEFEQKRRQLLQ
ncbi:MAG: NINE protein [Geminocystis sp.]|nr:NINE protein [Geminocystis sp.]HIK37798.1 NINE protein [Geminocystis sp. M7585_C2015_104]MCS7149018.1 NINE protein [Geminocystis sp.]MCX8078061.1 NINE protein [Geminocystis sp.]MDW8114838.1 NINE protein [Geminocystis sp.]